MDIILGCFRNCSNAFDKVDHKICFLNCAIVEYNWVKFNNNLGNELRFFVRV